MVSQEIRNVDTHTLPPSWGVATTGPTTGNLPRLPPAPGFGTLLRRYRERAGVSQQRLSARAQYDHTTVSRLESGRIEPTRKMVASLSASLGLYGRERVTFFVSAGYVPPEVMPLMWALLESMGQTP